MWYMRTDGTHVLSQLTCCFHMDRAKSVLPVVSAVGNDQEVTTGAQPSPANPNPNLSTWGFPSRWRVCSLTRGMGIPAPGKRGLDGHPSAGQSEPFTVHGDAGWDRHVPRARVGRSRCTPDAERWGGQAPTGSMVSNLSPGPGAACPRCSPGRTCCHMRPRAQQKGSARPCPALPRAQHPVRVGAAASLSLALM